MQMNPKISPCIFVDG